MISSCLYSATNPSLPPSVAQISAIDVDSEDLLQIICKQEEAQVNIAKLSNFRESNTRDQSACVLLPNLHNKYITSSNFGKVIHRCDSTDNTSIIKQMMGYSHVRATSTTEMGTGEGECSKKLLYQDNEQQRAQGVSCYVSWLDSFAKSFIPRGLC